MLWNRNKKNSAYSFEEKLVEKTCNDEVLLQDVKVVRVEHLKQVNGGSKGTKS
jgi:hypothetical protein